MNGHVFEIVVEVGKVSNAKANSSAVSSVPKCWADRSVSMYCPIEHISGIPMSLAILY